MSTSAMYWLQLTGDPRIRRRCSASVTAAALGAPLWRVMAGRPQRLPAARTARWLRLHEGELWVTADGRRDAPPPEDWWLSPGQSLRLPPGTPVLIEGWPTASFELLEEPRA